MDFKDQLKQLGDRVGKLKDQIHTEEATKNAFIMPFLQYLGYDVFNPLEVVPEYVTDIGTKKGEKIDYAILRDNYPVILVECKHHAQDLSLHDGQLLRYFHVSKARFGILTNGIVYRFYSDLVRPNIMDERPFLEFNIAEIKENQVEELKKFHKVHFNIDNIINTASELKYTSELKQLMHKEFTEPTEGFVKHFASQVYSSKITAKVLEQFTGLTHKSLNQYISDLITDRLKSALSKEVGQTQQAETAASQEVQENKIITTIEELEAFYIIKGILRKRVNGQRIGYRDAQSYCSILLDDNNRKAICRLYLNGDKKYIGLFDEQKKEAKHQIVLLDELYNYTDQLTATIDNYERTKEVV